VDTDEVSLVGGQAAVEGIVASTNDIAGYIIMRSILLS